MDTESSGGVPHLVEVDGPLSLGRFLKYAGAAATGGHAKILVEEGEVKVNGVVEHRRGRKVGTGDIVEIAEERFLVEIRGRTERE